MMKDVQEKEEEYRSYSFFGLMGYALPAILSMLVNAVYACVDGHFIGTYVGEQAVSAVELFLPIETLCFAFAFMLGSGGNAELERLTGSGRKEYSDSIFSDLFWTSILCGFVLTLVLVLLKNPIMVLLGAGKGAESMRVWFDQYYSVCMYKPLFYVASIALTVLMSGEGMIIRASLFSLAGGLVNVILDDIFLKYLHMGVPGAAYATVIGTVLSFGLMLIHYMPVWKNRRCFHFRRIRHFDRLGKICTNGVSEMISTLALSVSVLLMNRLMVKAGGQEGISALLVVSYATELFLSVFNGLNLVVEPLFSFHYGRGARKEIRKLFRQSSAWTLLIAFVGVPLLWIFRRPYVDLFFESGSSLCGLAIRALGFSLVGIALQGINVYIQCLFTSFSDAKISGILSLLNTFVFMVGAELLMAWLFGEDGLFAAQSVAETVTLFFSVYCLRRYRNKYGYC